MQSRERFGILIRPTGRFELMQIGFAAEDERLDDQRLSDALKAYFGGEYEWARNFEQLTYITKEGAFAEGMTRNDAASYLAGIGQHGDCIVLPKKEKGRINWSRAEAYKHMIKMECDWQWERDYAANPEKYKKKIRNAIKA